MLMRKQDCKRQQGFTLPELLVVLLLLSLLSSFLLRCFTTVARYQEQQLALLELEDNLALAMVWLRDDIAQSRAVTACTEEKLTLLQETVICYDLGTDQQEAEHLYSLEGKILYRKESTQWNRQPMANFIKTMTLYYYDRQGQPTAEPEAVRAVGICLTGCWREKTIIKRQVVPLLGATYL